MIETILIGIITILLARISSKTSNIEKLLEKFYLNSFNDEDYISQKIEREKNILKIVLIVAIIMLIIIFFKL